MRWVKISLILIWLVLLIDYWRPFLLRLELAQINTKMNNVCVNLLDNQIVKRKEIKFYVYYNPIWLATRGLRSAAEYDKQVYFGPLATRRTDFEVLVAHEIGHIENGSNSQYDADLFALRLLSNQKRNLVINALEAAGRSEVHILRLLLEFDTKYNHGMFGAGFGISVVPLGLSNPYFLRICKEIEAESYSKSRPSIEFVLDARLQEMAFSKWENGKLVISFHPFVLAWDEALLKVLAAHEIGHVALNTSDQLSADMFAANIVGKEIVKKVLLDLGLSNDHPRIIALSK